MKNYLTVNHKINNMNTRLRKLVPIIFILIIFFVPLLSHADVSIKNPLEGLDPNKDGVTDISDIIVGVINIVLGIAGASAVLALVYGGFTYISALGDQQKIQSAKTIITYAIVGVIICLASFAIVNILTKALSTGSLT
jgi:hypothetical protein